MITCANCGTKNEDTAKFCIKCGKRLIAIRPPKPTGRPSRISLTAGLLIGLMVMALSAGVVYYLLRPSPTPAVPVEGTPGLPSLRATPTPTPSLEEWLKPPATAVRPTPTQIGLEVEYLGRTEFPALREAKVPYQREAWLFTNKTSWALPIAYDITETDPEGFFVETWQGVLCRRCGSIEPIFRNFSMVPPGESIVWTHWIPEEDLDHTFKLTLLPMLYCEGIKWANIEWDPRIKFHVLEKTPESCSVAVENTGTNLGFGVAFAMCYNDNGDVIDSGSVQLFGIAEYVPPGEKVKKSFEIGKFGACGRVSIAGYDVVFLGLSEGPPVPREPIRRLEASKRPMFEPFPTPLPPPATPVPRFAAFKGDIFSFEYPSHWEVITEKEIDVLLDTSLKGMSPGGYDYIGSVYTGGVDGCRGCAHIVVVSLKDPSLTGTLTDEQYEQVKASYQNTMGSRLISVERVEVSGMPAVEVEKIGRGKDAKLRGVIIVPPESGRAYSFSCLSHMDFFDDFEAIFSRAIERPRIGSVALYTNSVKDGEWARLVERGHEPRCSN